MATTTRTTTMGATRNGEQMKTDGDGEDGGAMGEGIVRLRDSDWRERAARARIAQRRHLARERRHDERAT